MIEVIVATRKSSNANSEVEITGYKRSGDPEVYAKQAYCDYVSKNGITVHSQSLDGPECKVKVTSDGSRYLKSESDASIFNNLLSLPDC